MISRVLATILIALPLVAIIVESSLSSGISEHHHRDHDVYTVAHSLSRVPVVIMGVMGLLGLVLAQLSSAGVFMAPEAPVLSFFAAFVIVTFVMWASLRCYRVITYDGYMKVRSFGGLTSTVRYADIERVRWSSMRSLISSRSAVVYVGGHVATVLVGTVDLDQILLRINRDDAIEHD